MRDDFFKNLFLILLSAIILMLATPPFTYFFCAYFTLPIVLLIITKSNRPALYGFLYGFFYNSLSMYWITYVLSKYGNLPYFISFFLFLLLVAYLSLYQCIFFFLFKKYNHKFKPYINPVIYSFLWVILEVIRSKFLTGFPWMLIAYTQYNFPPVIQIVSKFGIYSLSFLIVFVNLSIYLLFTRERLKYLPTVFSLIIIVSLYLWGSKNIDSIKKEFQSRRKLNVLLVQGNIDQSQKWEKDLQKNILLKHLKMTRDNIDKETDLVVWSETAMPLIFGADKEITEFFRKESADIEVPIISGFVGYKWDDRGNPKLTNSAGIFYKGDLVDKYDKVHLVPFGEYVPLQKILFFVNKLVSAAGDFIAGDTIKTCNFRDVSYGVMICYESIFPEISKEFVNKGANVLVNITNDAWFGNSPAPYQHFSMSIFRAVENRKFLIRVANTGITGIISPWGEVQSKTSLYEDRIVKGVIYY
ncbi:MAG: apolipoprotein N-acyltransferase [Proteobacteria bacterium]|nr:apolipoprotein N-acyltransferase [Pseudomonadota bacterium]